MNSLSIAEGQQELDQRTLQVHNAPNAVSIYCTKMHCWIAVAQSFQV